MSTGYRGYRRGLCLAGFELEIKTSAWFQHAILLRSQGSDSCRQQSLIRIRATPQLPQNQLRLHTFPEKLPQARSFEGAWLPAVP